MGEIGWFVLLICISTGTSLFFALNNLALRTFSRLKLEEAFEQLGQEKRMGDFFKNSEALAITCGIFRIASNIVLLLLIIELLKDKHYLMTFFVLLGVSLFFTLAVPHSWAKHSGEYILPRTWRILYGLSFVIRPLIQIFQLHDKLVRRLAGVEEVNFEQKLEERQEEILNLVEQGQKEGVVDEDEVEMIENVLDFADTTVGEIMTPRTDLTGIRVDSTLEDIVKNITTEGHSRVPVYEDTIDNIIGFIYAKDLLSEIGKDTNAFDIRLRMRKAYYVPESKPLKDLLNEFRNRKLHIAVVLDEYGGTAGLVTIEDILEELVGDIADEYEESQPEELEIIDDKTIEADARIYIDDLNNECELELPEEEDYDTLGGFVFSHLGYIPKAGDSFEYKNMKITITMAEARSVRRVRIEKAAGNGQLGT